jgi:MFS family permease
LTLLNCSQIFSFVGFGSQAAPVLGGVLYAKVGYSSVFALCMALIGIDIVLRLLMIEKKTAARYHEDITSLQPESSTGEADENTPLISQSDSARDLGAYEVPPPKSWIAQKMPIVMTFRNPALLTAFYITFAQAFLLGCYDSTIPLVALEYYNFDSLKSGLLFLALGVPGMITGPIAGWTTDKYGARVVAVVGFLYLVPTHILLRIPQPGGTHQVIIFAVILAFTSIGNSIIDSPALVEAGLIVERFHKANPMLFGETGPYAQLYGINSMMFSLGITVGPIVAGALKDTIGYGNMNAVMAALCASAAALSWLYLGTEPRPVLS